jgi:hypothetical protein
MTLFSKYQRDGEVFVDHRNSPGVPEEMAIQAGYDPKLMRGGQCFTAPTLGCVHCGAHVMLSPTRRRDRCHCPKCDAYVCDICGAAMREPDYVHMTIVQICDIMHTGKFELSGSMSRPVLKPFDRILDL